MTYGSCQRMWLSNVQMAEPVDLYARLARSTTPTAASSWPSESPPPKGSINVSVEAQSTWVPSCRKIGPISSNIQVTTLLRCLKKLMPLQARTMWLSPNRLAFHPLSCMAVRYRDRRVDPTIPT